MARVNSNSAFDMWEVNLNLLQSGSTELHKVSLLMVSSLRISSKWLQFGGIDFSASTFSVWLGISPFNGALSGT